MAVYRGWDPDRVSQILTNLMGNAVEHGSPDGPVTVSVSGEADAVVIGIHNHGVPIPAAQARRIFDPMKRRESGSSAHLGLGLYDPRAAHSPGASTGDLEGAASRAAQDVASLLEKVTGASWVFLVEVPPASRATLHAASRTSSRRRA